ncbi:hypothetical protein ACTXT7_006004 [Hymenolepis weldensis]
MSRGLVVLTEITQKYQSSIDRADLLPIRQLSYEHQKQSLPRCRFCGECCYHRDWLIEDAAARTATKMIRKKASAEILLRAISNPQTAGDPPM